jgi:hypothetical protein
MYIQCMVLIGIEQVWGASFKRATSATANIEIHYLDLNRQEISGSGQTLSCPATHTGLLGLTSVSVPTETLAIDLVAKDGPVLLGVGGAQSGTNFVKTGTSPYVWLNVGDRATIGLVSE